MRSRWLAGVEPEDREFLLVLGACTLAYGLAVWGLSFVPTPTRSSTDVASLPPRIAKLIMEAPPPPPVALKPPEPVATSPAPAKATPQKAPSKAKTEAKPAPAREVPPPPEPVPLSEEELQARAAAALEEARLRLEAETAARREQARAVAKQSGLLKALADAGGGGGVGQGPALDRVLGDVAVLSNPALPPSGSAGSGAGLGQGTGQGVGPGSGGSRLSVDEIVAGLKGDGTGEAVVLAGKATARVSSALSVEEELLAKRSDESIYKMLKTLDPWLKLKYHAALKDHPGLGDFLSVRFTITPEGDVVDCQVRESRLGYPPLEETVLKRICLLKFPPLTQGIGEVIDATYTIDFTRFS
ncbi:MAG: AgmX/PglI C-terminal domain-containing protein [Nitrospirota bacterium]